MANIKSQIKRSRTNEVRRMRNIAKKSAMKTAVKAVETAVAANDKATATTALAAAYTKLDSAVKHGIIHANAAARQKSRLSLKVNTLA